MKKYALIAGLILSLSLTACNNNGVPKKEKYSNEVDYATFNEGINKVMGNDSELIPSGSEEDEQPSLKLVSKITSDEKQVLKGADEKEIGNMVSKITLNQESQYDGKNNISKIKTKGSGTSKLTLNGEVNEEKVSLDYTRIFQVIGEGEEKKNVSVNEKDKEYYVASDSPVTQTVMVIALPLLFIGFGTAGWDTKTDAEKAKWHFYIDKEVLFTLTYTDTSTKELKDTISGEYTKYADEVEEETVLMQIKALKKKDELKGMTIYFEMKSVETTTYVVDYEDEDAEMTFHAGEVLTGESEVVIATRLELAKVILAPVDLSSYTLKDKDTEGELNPLSN